MDLNEYQELTDKTAIYPTTSYKSLSYLALGLAGESGEVANKIKKICRDSNGLVPTDVAHAIAIELGDILWYLGQLSQRVGYSLEQVASMNLQKLNSRKERGVLGGSGDDR